MKKRLIDLFIVLMLVCVVSVGAVLTVNPEIRNKVIVALYPMRAQLSVLNIACSDDSPAWMASLLGQLTKEQEAPANQITYISPQGQISHCENGYTGKPLFSDAITPNTRFRFASVTKLWTSDAILSFIRQGKLQLDDTFYGLFPELPEPKDPRVKAITIADLLRHRGGFDRYSIFGQNMFVEGKSTMCPDHLERLAEIELGFTPGEKTSYSNIGYCLLGEVIHKLSGQPYSDYIAQQYSFADTSLKFIGEQQLSDEPDYYYIETGITGVADIYTAFDYRALASAAGLSGNALDLAKQVKGMLEKAQPNILAEADPLCDTSKMAECYGYAMRPYQEENGDLKVYFRTGSLLGLSSLVAVDQYGGITALLSSGNYNNSNNVLMQLYQDLMSFYNTTQSSSL